MAQGAPAVQAPVTPTPSIQPAPGTQTPRVQTNESEGGVGDLLVAPTRVLLESRTRTAEVTLNNRGTTTATYRLSLIHLKMDETGAYKELDEAEARKVVPVADDLLRYSPHQVTLEPGQSQVVKIMARKPEGLPEGEYTSHLLFRAVPDVSMGQNVESKAEDEGKIAIRLVPIYGISIPVIVRHGNLAAQTQLVNAKKTGNAISLTIARSGTKSTFGDLIATSGNTVVGQLRGIAVLIPNSQRNVSIPLDSQPNGPVTVQYRESGEEGSKVLATTNL